MTPKFNITDRKPVWEKLSLFYLDTELDASDYQEIALSIAQSPYGLEQVKDINKREVFPVLYTNLITVAGAWEGFDVDWLVEEILKENKRRNFLSKRSLMGIHGILKGRFTDHWKEVEKAMAQINSI